MIPIYRMAVVQIELTNACNLSCSSCTRFCGHHPKPFFMDIETVERALSSLADYPSQIGFMGGEPTLHPEFSKLCRLFRDIIPQRRKRQLWTNGLFWDKYKDDISQTFDPDMIIYNDHRNKEVGIHQPLLIVATDVLSDRELMWRLIGNCWVQWRWAAAVTPKGGFFCEVAAAQDMLFNGPGGYELKPGWWNKDPNQFSDQVKRYCPNCSAAIPMPGISSHADFDVVSRTNAKRLEQIGSPRYKKGLCKLVDMNITEEGVERTLKAGWTPWSHRPYKQSSPETTWID